MLMLSSEKSRSSFWEAASWSVLWVILGFLCLQRTTYILAGWVIKCYSLWSSTCYEVQHDLEPACVMHDTCDDDQYNRTPLSQRYVSVVHISPLFLFCFLLLEQYWYIWLQYILVGLCVSEQNVVLIASLRPPEWSLWEKSVPIEIMLGKDGVINTAVKTRQERETRLDVFLEAAMHVALWITSFFWYWLFLK